MCMDEHSRIISVINQGIKHIDLCLLNGTHPLMNIDEFFRLKKESAITNNQPSMKR